MSQNHYTFVHALRDVCATDPLRFFASMASPERCRLLQGLWQQSSFNGGTALATCPVATTTTLRDCPVVVVAMPLSSAAGEAQFVGLVLTGLPACGQTADDLAVRCFTVERGSDGHHATLCEVRGDERVVLEVTPSATAPGFLAAMERRLG